MDKIFPAHIRINPDMTETIQTVSEHCICTASCAERLLRSVKLEKAAYMSGLLHDCGKYTQRFAEFLDDAVHGKASAAKTVNHTFAGVRFILSRYHHPEGVLEVKDIVSELLAYAAGAHHGLFDCINEARKSGFQHRLEEPDIGYEEAIENFLRQCADLSKLDSLFSDAVNEISPLLEKIENLASQNEQTYDSEFCFYSGLLSRLLLSAVIEGDRRDTAEFMNHFTYTTYPENMTSIWKSCLSRIEEKLKRLPSDTAIQKARQMISQQCRDFAENPGGIFRLNVPTGSGKTLSSLRYAVAHAAQWNKSRIIFTSPLLSILDQNAEVIRGYVQDDSLILEHHSNVIREKADPDRLDPQELFAENWDAPILITTLVQLLNTLFSGRTTCIRRFHALCNSVIVIDEVQTVPVRMLTQFNLAINFLSTVCGATILLCSATQPCLEALPHSLIYSTPGDLVPYDASLWAAFRRTMLVDAGAYRLEDIPSFIRGLPDCASSILIVCNKREEASQLYRFLSNDTRPCFHLSASMCMEHRRSTMIQINTLLEQEKPLICVSTQVIEAGVDISFDCVVRIIAGIDNAIQSAGRCNRNGKASSPVPAYLLQCLDEQLTHLPDIRRAQNASIDLLEEYRQHPEKLQNDLASDEAIRYYYHRLYGELPHEYTDYSLPDQLTLYSLLSLNEHFADTDCPQYGRFFLNQAFKTAGILFQVFDSETTDIIVPYGEGTDIITDLCSQRAQHDTAYFRQRLEAAKPYTVSLFQYQKQLLERHGALISVCNNSVLVLSSDYYDETIGLIFTQKSENTGRYEKCGIQIL